jgi:hypothetical protein
MLNSASGGSQPEDLHRDEESRVRAYAPVLVIAFAFICSGRSFRSRLRRRVRLSLSWERLLTGVSGSKIRVENHITLLLGLGEDSVVRCDSRGFGAAESSSKCGVASIVW